MRHLDLLAMFAVCLLAAGCQSNPAHTARALAAADLATMIPLTEALSIAQTEVPDGVAVGAVLEVEDDDEKEPPAWEVSFFVAGANQVIDVEVDAVTGAVLEVEVEDDGPDDDGSEKARQ
jgi:uncharacterized membrane protein YkoI